MRRTRAPHYSRVTASPADSPWFGVRAARLSEKSGRRIAAPIQIKSFLGRASYRFIATYGFSIKPTPDVERGRLNTSLPALDTHCKISTEPSV
jgi:hypothetical protein